MEKHVEKESKDSKNVQSLSGDFRVITCALYKACRLFNPQRCIWCFSPKPTFQSASNETTVIIQTGLLHTIIPLIAPQTNPKSRTDAQTDCDAIWWLPERRALMHCPIINNGAFKLIKWLQSYSSKNVAS